MTDLHRDFTLRNRKTENNLTKAVRRTKRGHVVGLRKSLRHFILYVKNKEVARERQGQWMEFITGATGSGLKTQEKH